MQLPLDLFPNGSTWFRRHTSVIDSAYLVHFNWDKVFFEGPKESIMQYYSMWASGDANVDQLKKLDVLTLIVGITCHCFLRDFEGLGNKLLALANCIEISDQKFVKIIVDWRDGRYPVESFQKYLK